MTTLLLAVLAIAPMTGAPVLDSLSFAQIDIDYDGGSVFNSSFGYVRLSHNGYPSAMYLNVNVDGRWEVENALVTSVDGIRQQQEGFHFNIGVPDGMNITEIMVGASLTPDILLSPPPPDHPVGVGNKLESLNSFMTSSPLRLGVATAFKGKKKRGGPSEGKIEGVPNQPCGPNQCVPTAISNLLKWLKAKYPGIKLPDDAITITAIALALGWGDTGVPFDVWVDRKRKYLEAFCKIKTTKHNQGEGDIQVLINGLNSQMAVVEMEVGAEDQDGGHVVAVCSLTKLEGGKCSVTFKHDPVQKNNPADVVTETITFEMSNGKITEGPAWAQGKKIKGFAMETLPVKAIPK